MILENKLNLTNQVDLAKAEEKLSKRKAKQLFDSGAIDEIQVGTYKGWRLFMAIFLRRFTTSQGNCVRLTWRKGISVLRL